MNDSHPLLPGWDGWDGAPRGQGEEEEVLFVGLGARGNPKARILHSVEAHLGRFGEIAEAEPRGVFLRTGASAAEHLESFPNAGRKEVDFCVDVIDRVEHVVRAAREKRILRLL